MKSRKKILNPNYNNLRESINLLKIDIKKQK